MDPDPTHYGYFLRVPVDPIPIAILSLVGRNRLHNESWVGPTLILNGSLVGPNRLLIGSLVGPIRLKFG
ncbi:hypothetical protein Lalb_Chr20g0114591 [Lupinus albus]|uniref:Uncharacterized protein n=1 Tax=Lupinus albus TaxID=3870 RepID=A0A6A4NPF3_LUPAL|nr:hypothetical protein Lalb_Chr20g0114591 [Lupinus albus]